MSERCVHDYPIDGDGSPGDRCHRCIEDEGFDEGVEAAAQLAEHHNAATRAIADRIRALKRCALRPHEHGE